MQFEQSFEVSAPIEEVWDLLIDLERVASCLPGAAITGRDGDGVCHGTFELELGPTTASFRGQAELAGVDPSAHTATVTARGSDRRGEGGASATILNALVDIDGGTRVRAVADLTITGRLARFGRGGMIEDVANRLTRDFADCLQARLAAAVSPAAPAPPGLTPAEAVASAGAEVRPEDSALEGKSPAELNPPAAADEPVPGPADNDSAPGQRSAGRPALEPSAPPAASEPIHRLRPFSHQLGERLRRLLRGAKR